MNGHNITAIVDFRSSHEKADNPVTWHPDWAPTYHDVPIGGNAAAWIQEMLDSIDGEDAVEKGMRTQLLKAYETIPIENHTGLKAFFDGILGNTADGALLFHCKMGKDRTGIAGALLHKALGVSDDDIMEDFLLTNTAMDLDRYCIKTAQSLSERTGRKIQPRDVIPLVGVEEDYLHAAYRVINETYGNLETYLRDAMGLTPERMKALENRLLEG